MTAWTVAPGNNLTYGGDGNDSLVWFDETQTFYGGGGNDITSDGIGVLIAYGGSGNDTIIGSDGAKLYLDQGNDVATLDGGRAEGGDGADAINVVSKKSVEVYGQAGNDTVTAIIAGNATLNGGDGNDVITVSSNTSGYTVSHLLVADTGGTNTFNIHPLWHDDKPVTVQGGSGADKFNLSFANQMVVSGGEGANLLTAESAAGLTYTGGSGIDTMILGDTQYGVGMIHLGGGNDVINPGMTELPFYGGAEFLSDLHIFVYAGTGKDALFLGFAYVYGEDGADTLGGNSSVLYGGAGNDLLIANYTSSMDGGAGDDLLVRLEVPRGYENGDVAGGSGNDTLEMGSGRYSIFAPDAVGTETDYADVTGVETLLFTGTSLTIADYWGLDLTFDANSQGIEARVAGHVYTLGSGADGCVVYVNNTTIYGGDDADRMTLKTGSQVLLDGGAGDDDFFAYVASAVTMVGGLGDDFASVLGNATVSGDDGNDEIHATGPMSSLAVPAAIRLFCWRPRTGGRPR